MNCPLCGEVCRCPSESSSPAVLGWTPDAEPPALSSAANSQPEPALASHEEGQQPHATGGDPEQDSSSSAEEDTAWRDELSARLNRYRARRKIRPPRYPSLRLQFDAVEPLTARAGHTSAPPVFETASDHALALDGMMQGPSTPVEQPDAPDALPAAAAIQPPPASHIAKILEFPRFAWGPPPPPPDQLAEPVAERPRILEAPEVVPAPPALGGITIDAQEREEADRRPGIDIPLLGASPARRLLASSIDGLIVAAASALFGLIFWKVAGVRPPLAQLVGLTAGVPCLLWWIYEYLLIVYSGATPGMRAVGLELARFDGTRPNRRVRRWRVLASYLSGASLGMGYAWVFLDEDALCWHDRITHTHLAPRKQQ